MAKQIIYKRQQEYGDTDCHYTWEFDIAEPEVPPDFIYIFKEASEDAEEFEIVGDTLVRYNGKNPNVTIPDGVKSIYLDAFRGAVLDGLTLPPGLSEIGEYSFAECANLEEIKITGSVSEVPTGAFSGCEGLISIYLPESVSSIGMGAFYGCDSLKTLTYGGTAEKWNAAKKAVNNAALESATVIYEK